MFVVTTSVVIQKNPQAKAWGYTDKARLRGLKPKTDFLQPDLVSVVLLVQRPDFSRYLIAFLMSIRNTPSPQTPLPFWERGFEKYIMNPPNRYSS
jgi:hypothetical protein